MREFRIKYTYLGPVDACKRAWRWRAALADELWRLEGIKSKILSQVRTEEWQRASGLRANILDQKVLS